MSIKFPIPSKLMYCEQERLQTFYNWPFKDDCNNCNPRMMAEAGWYCREPVKYPDWTACFFCHADLEGWEPQDDPWEEHRVHSLECAFVKVGKKQADMTLKEHLDLSLKYDIYRLQARQNELKQLLVEKKNKVINRMIRKNRC